MMRQKKAWLGAFAAGAMLAGTAATASADQTFRWTDGGPNRGARAQGLQWLAQQVTKRTNGSVKFEFHWAGALMPTKAALRGVGRGAADVGAIVAAYTPRELSAYSVVDLPFEISDIWVTMRASYELATTHPALKKMFNDLNIVYISNLTTTPSQIICVRSHIKTIDDLKGVKLRATGFYGKVYRSLGAKIVSMGQAKVYTALDSGVVECNQNYLYAIPVFKQHEIAKKLTILNWGQFLAYGIVINKAAYGKLSDAEKKAMHAAGSDFVDHYSKVQIGNSDTALAKVKANGVEVHTMAAAELNRLQKAAGPEIKKWVERTNGNGLPGQDLFDTYQRLLRKYEAIRVKQGYPWQRK